MRELAARASNFREWATRARERWRDERFSRCLRDRTVFADEGEDFPGWQWLMSITKERSASIFDYLKDTVLLIDEPVAVESFLTSAFQTLGERYAENDAADDLGLAPHELYLTAEQLRARIDALQRVGLRALRRSEAKMEQDLAPDAEQPTRLI